MKELKISEILTKALANIRKGWTQDDFARNKSDKSVDEKSNQAVKWCSYGAIYRATPDGQGFQPTLRFLRKAIGRSKIAVWNDSSERKKSEVVAAFRKAITLAKEAGQ